jgi:hypothetical protein
MREYPPFVTTEIPAEGFTRHEWRV